MPLLNDTQILAAPECTLVIPTYNASAFIATSVKRLSEFLAINTNFCALFVCDGCSDDTAAKLTALIAAEPRMALHVYTQNRGKGYALRRGMSLAQTPYRIFTDVDFAYAPHESLKLLEHLKAGADMVVVNRAHPDSRFLISPVDFPSIYKRHRMSRLFNGFLRFMLPIKILDTQAGLKGLTAKAWAKIGPQLQTDGFFIDVELLSYAGAARMKITETPIYFDYVDPSTVKLITHGWSMIVDTVKLRLRLHRDAELMEDYDAMLTPTSSL